MPLEKFLPARIAAWIKVVDWHLNGFLDRAARPEEFSQDEGMF